MPGATQPRSFIYPSPALTGSPLDLALMLSTSNTSDQVSVMDSICGGSWCWGDLSFPSDGRKDRPSMVYIFERAA